MACLFFTIVSEPHNQQAHDLFIGSMIGAWANLRLFRDGYWYFSDA
ncbi:hypothetical protein KTH71_00765 [Acinetobacter sp. WU_MDCI_Axc73]|nr:hypothetical protein [Acinetobacter sp. WU_MDCI_Axc73]